MRDSKKRSKSRQDFIRNDLLNLMRNLISAGEGREEKIVGCWVDGYITGLNYYKHRLDLHNKSVLDNLSQRMEMIRKKYTGE